MKKVFLAVVWSSLLVGLLLGMYHYQHRVPLVSNIPYFPFETHPKSQEKAVFAINEIRENCRTRFRIVSSYRSPQKNKKVKGKSKSQHLHGKAFDVVVPMSMRADFYTCSKKSGFKGFGWSNTTVHIDLGPKRWWTYDDGGEAVSGEEKYKYIHKAPDNFRKEYGL